VASDPTTQKPTAARTHPIYDLWVTVWRKLARYENVASPIVDHKIAALFRAGPKRQVDGGNGDQSHPWLDWCETDVDGSGTCLDDFNRDAWRLGAIFGHSVVVMDRKSTVPNPQTKAEQGQPILRLYSALDLFDWLVDDTGRLTGVRLYEAAPRASFEDSADTDATRYRIRTLTETTFTVTEEVVTSVGGQRKVVEVTTIDTGEHGFGCLPAVILYGKRRALMPIVGQSVLYDPQLYYDLYNLRSECRELLRKQTFSVLNVPLGTGDQATRVEDAQAMLGAGTGTTNVLFTALPALYISADTSNVTVYQEECRQLLRTIYRLANVPFETDSKDAESEGSLTLKREDMNQVLASYADELQRCEEQITDLWFRAQFGESGWEKAKETDQPESKYPETFDVQPFEELLQAAQAAMALPLGRSATFMREYAKRLVPEFLPDLPQDTLDAINEELEALPDPEEERQQQMQAKLDSMAEGFTPKPGDDDDEPKEPAA
jgi:hypothetical protein